MSIFLLTISSKMFRKAFWAVNALAVFATILDLAEACELSIKYAYALTLRITDQKNNITDGLQVTVVLHIRDWKL